LFARRKPPKITVEVLVFTKEDVEDGIRGFPVGRARDIEGLHTEHLN
jgi:hypothetical protein